MSKNNIFTEDIVIPPIVLKKADSAFLNIKTERNCGMRDKKKSNEGREEGGGRKEKREKKEGKER